MRIERLGVRGYRTLEYLDLTFPAYYAAICGRNDSGKTNVVTAIRRLFLDQDRYYYPGLPFPYAERLGFSFKDDYTKWSTVEQKKRSISLEIALSIDAKDDAGIYSFLADYLGIEGKPDQIDLQLSFSQPAEGPKTIAVTANKQRFDGLKAEEVLKRFRTSPTFLFHSSTDPEEQYSGSRGALRDISEEHSQKLDKSQKSVNNVLRRVARGQEEKIESLLGRLKDRYKVRLSCPTFNLSHFPYNITLGDKKLDVDLDDWGSGTRNRTQILLTVFRAKQVAESPVSSSKVTPVIVIEEPESFLHPLAQAEFGRVLQDLAEEFRVQTIVTTHSPYLLSQERPESNILLERKVVRRQLRQTERVDTSGEKWMEPFSLSLGLSDEAFAPWKGLFFSQPEAVVLVEGDTDQEYIEMLRSKDHGESRLAFDGMVFSYGGRDTLKNQSIVRFIKDRFDRIFVTFDLDSKSIVEKSLMDLGLRERVHYLAVGVDEAGQRCIEGLLPEPLRTKVRAANPKLVDALSGTTEERRDANNHLKKLYLQEFKKEARPGEDHFRRFYELARAINRGFRNQATATSNPALQRS